MTQQLIRIGKGVPGADRSKRKIKPAAYWVLAAAVLIAVGAMVWAVYFFDPPTSKPVVVASVVDNRVECASIAREFEIWSKGRDDLEWVRTDSPTVAEIRLRQLVEDADSFARATTGYADVRSKELAVAVATYRVELGFLVIENTAGAEISEAHHTATLRAWTAAEADYRSFMSATC